MTLSDRQIGFISAAKTLPNYSGWTDDEISSNINEVLNSGDQKRVSGLSAALGGLDNYKGWEPIEIQSNLTEIFPAQPAPQHAQQAPQPTHTMSDGTVMPGATHPVDLSQIQVPEQPVGIPEPTLTTPIPEEPVGEFAPKTDFPGYQTQMPAESTGQVPIEEDPGIQPIATLKEGTKQVGRTGVGFVKGLHEAGRETLKKEAARLEDVAKEQEKLGNVDYAKYLREQSKPALEEESKRLDKVAKVADKVINSEVLKTDPTWKQAKGAKKYIQDVIMMVPQVAGQIGATALTGGVGGITFMGAQIAGGQYEDLIQKGVKPERALAASVVNAAIQAPLEQISLKFMTKLWKPGGKLVQNLTDVAAAGGSEFLTEWIQKYPELATEIWATTKGEDLSARVKEFGNRVGKATEEGIYEGLVALPLGMIGGGGGKVAATVASPDKAKLPEPTVEDVFPGMKPAEALPDIAEAQPEKGTPLQPEEPDLLPKMPTKEPEVVPVEEVIPETTPIPEEAPTAKTEAVLKGLDSELRKQKKQAKVSPEAGMSLERDQLDAIKEDFETTGLSPTRKNFQAHWESLSGEKLSKEGAKRKIRQIWGEYPVLQKEAPIDTETIEPKVEKEVIAEEKEEIQERREKPRRTIQTVVDEEIEAWIEDGVIAPEEAANEKTIRLASVAADRTARNEVTGLKSKAHKNTSVDKAFKEKKEDEEIIIAQADQDFFKPFNDTYGHIVGDDVLKQSMAPVSQLFETAGFEFFHDSGDEASALIKVKKSDVKKSYAEIEKIKDAMDNIEIVLPNGNTVPLSMTFAISNNPDKAEKLLAETKKSPKLGKNSLGIDKALQKEYNIKEKQGKDVKQTYIDAGLIGRGITSETDQDVQADIPVQGTRGDRPGRTVEKGLSEPEASGREKTEREGGKRPVQEVEKPKPQPKPKKRKQTHEAYESKIVTGYESIAENSRWGKVNYSEDFHKLSKEEKHAAIGAEKKAVSKAISDLRGQGKLANVVALERLHLALYHKQKTYSTAAEDTARQESKQVDKYAETGKAKTKLQERIVDDMDSVVKGLKEKNIPVIEINNILSKDYTPKQIEKALYDISRGNKGSVTSNEIRKEIGGLLGAGTTPDQVVDLIDKERVPFRKDISEPVEFTKSIKEVEKMVSPEMWKKIDINVTGEYGPKKKTLQKGTHGAVWSSNGKINIAINPKSPPSQIARTLFHEVLGHAGAANVLKTNPKMHKRIAAIYKSQKDSRLVKRIRKAYEPEMKSNPDMAEDLVFSEYIAHTIEDHLANPKKRGASYQVWKAIKQFLIDLGISKDSVDDVLNSMVKEMRKLKTVDAELFISPRKAKDFKTPDKVVEKAKPQTETKAFKNLSRFLGSSSLANSVMSSLNQSGIDSLKANAKAISDFLKRGSITTKSDGSIDIPPSVLSHVSQMGGNDEVFGSIVRLLPIDVVNLFKRKKLSAKSVLGNKAMLKNIFSIKGEPSVTLTVNVADSLMSSIAGTATKLSSLADRALKAVSAPKASIDDSILSTHTDKNITRGKDLPRSFFKWFGDSKVVDEDGKPLVVFHGTDKKFDSFDITKGGKNYKDMASKAGFFFAKTQDGASQFGKKIISAYLSAKKIMTVDLDTQTEYVEKWLDELKETDPKEWEYQTDTKAYDNTSGVNKGVELAVVDAKERGYDGVKILDEEYFEDDWYVVFEPTQIKSATGNVGTFDPEDPRIMFSKSLDDKAFYSPTDRTISDLKQEKGVVPQILSMIRKGQLKKAEVEWMGLEDFLKENPKATKSEVLDFVRSNEIEVVESTLAKETDLTQSIKKLRSDLYKQNLISAEEARDLSGGEIREIAREQGYLDDETKYSQYSLPGGENYREMLFKMPVEKTTAPPEITIVNVKGTKYGYEVEFSDGSKDAVGKGTIGDSATDQEVKDYFKNILSEMNKLAQQKYETAQKKGQYKSSHWDEPNVFAHARVNDRTTPEGEKVLFIEEIQSDWQREAREKGTRPTGDKPTDQQVIDYFGLSEDANPADFREEMMENPNWKNVGVPDFPFRKNWQEYVLKNILRKASEGGYDRIAWVTGEQTANRYALSKQADRVTWNPDDNMLRVFKDGDVILSQTLQSESQISDYIGKDPAKKLLESEVKKSNTSPPVQEISGEGLKVGGKWAEALYDKMIPKFLNKYAKKWGAKTEETKVLTKGKIGDSQIGVTRQLSLPITPEMRESVMEGQPMFSKDLEYNTNGIPEETFSDNIRQKVQDRFHRLKVIQKALSPDISDELDVYTKQELIHGRTEAKLDQFEEKLFKPLRNTMAAYKVDMDTLEEYLYAKHAPERNEHIRKIRRKHTGEALTAEEADLVSKADELGGRKADWEAAIKTQQLTDREKGEIYTKISNIDKKLDKINTQLEQLEITRDKLMPIAEAGSGMTDQEAQSIIDKSKENGTHKKLEKLSTMVEDITSRSRQQLLDGGLISKETKDAWEKYKHYVPLIGLDEPDIAPQKGIKGVIQKLKPEKGKTPQTGKGFDIRGKESQRALGRKSKAKNILANTVMQMNEAIIRAEKNKVGQAFLEYVKQNPNKDLWEIEAVETKPKYNESKGEVEYKEEKVRAYKDPKTGQLIEPMSVKVDGKEHKITIKDASLARGMVNLGAEKSNKVLQILGAYNRYLSLMSTSLVPSFVASNFTRDLQTVLINVSSEKSFKIAKDIVKDIPTAIYNIGAELEGLAPARKVIRKVTGKKESPVKRKWQKYYQEFKAEGGKIGFFGLHDVNEIQKNIVKEIDLLQGGNKASLIKAFRGAKDFVMSANEAVENGARLSTYVTLRENGYSKQKAASAAKNITVNFNRKGELGTWFNSLYLFSGASIQGTTRLLQAMKTSKGKKIAAGIMAGSLAIAQISRLMGGEDDDGEDYYDKIPDWIKENNLVLLRPGIKTLDGKGFLNSWHYIKIPVPYGYNVFHAVGQAIDKVAHNRDSENVLSSAGMIAGSAANAFNPLGSSSTFTQTIAPTFLKLAADLDANKNFYGAPIMKEERYGTPRTRSHTNQRKTSWASKKTARFINNIFGGNEYEPGLSGYADISPDAMDYVVQSMTGGVGKMLNQSFSMLVNTGRGKETPVGQIPFVRRFMGEVPEYEDQQRFYKNLDKIDAVKAMHKRYLEYDRQKAYQYAQKNRVILGYTRDRDGEPSRINELNKQLKALKKRRDKAEDGGNEELVKKLNEVINKRYKLFNKTFKERTK